MSASQWGDVINTNLNSVFNVTRPVIEGMRERKWGRVIQISSINGLKGQYGQANYAAAKAGMHGFTISLARENAKLGITVNTVSPGYVATDMVMAVPEEVRAKIVADIPTGRLGKPEEIAYAVGFLVADEAAWITGSNLDINGGHHMGWRRKSSVLAAVACAAAVRHARWHMKSRSERYRWPPYASSRNTRTAVPPPPRFP